MSELIKTGKRLFHTGDLALIWQINRPATLHMRLMRYVDKGILYPIQRGLYSIVPLDKLNPEEVAVTICHDYCYLTMETILERYGAINQRVYGLTFVSNRSKTVIWQENRFIFRKLKDKYLFQTAGIEIKGDILVANLERAVADMIYFNPKYYFDAQSAIDWNKVFQIQREVGYK